MGSQRSGACYGVDIEALRAEPRVTSGIPDPGAVLRAIRGRGVRVVGLSLHPTFGQTLVIDGELRVGDPSAFLHEGRLLLEEVRAAGSRPVLLVPPLGPDARPLDQQAVDWAYTRLGRESGARLAPVSDAFARVRRRRPEGALFDAHGNEWSTAGAYLASAVLEATVTGRHPGASSGPILAEAAAEAAADKTEIEPGTARGRLSAELLQLLDREAWAAVRDLAADGGYRDIRPPAFPPVPTLPHGSVVPAATLEGTWTGPLRLYPWPATLELRVTAASGTPRVTGHVRFEDGPRDLTSDGSDFTYDPFGNLATISSSANPRILSPDAATNRLESPFTYDVAGNLTSQPTWDFNGYPTTPTAWYYSYDAFNRMTRARNASGSITRDYVYTADGERLAVLAPGRELWTLRGPDNRVLRDFEYVSTGWRRVEDYIHRGSGLLATIDATGDETHYHLDHLGTPRLLTDAAKQVLARHVHAPYGEELTSTSQNELRMKFTGHERDDLDTSGKAGDLDYMHARYYSGTTGRFNSIDPSRRSWDPKRPQTWNRYTYVANDPLSFNDPDGERQNPVTGKRGVKGPAHGKVGHLRASPWNPDIGRFGHTRRDQNGNPKFHAGIDINAQTGTPLRAPEDGTVTRVSNGPQGGLRIDVESGSGEMIILVHLDSIDPKLKPGVPVTEGEVVGESGTTGNQASPGDPGYDPKQEHVHMTVLDAQGNRIDPEAWLNDPNAPPPRP